MIEYSIVATTFNDEKSILKFLDNICKQTVLPKEVVIADGGSNDKTIDIVKSYNSDHVKIRLLQSGRLNIAEGYNLAIKSVITEMIGITGVGNIYEADYFKKLIERYQEGNSDIVYSPIRGYNSTSFSQKYNNTILNGEQGQRMPIASNHGALIKKKVYEELDYYYERFIYAGEDAEFFLLANKKGYRVSCVDDAVVRWITPKTFGEYIKQVKNYAIAALQFRKNIWIIHKIFTRGLLLLCNIFFFLTIKSIGKYLILVELTAFFLQSVKLRKQKKNIFIWVCDKMLPPFFYFIYIKYMKADYKVTR